MYTTYNDHQIGSRTSVNIPGSYLGQNSGARRRNLHTLGARISHVVDYILHNEQISNVYFIINKFQMFIL